LFFGLAKQFKTTVLPSIRQYVLSPNQGCDVYAHTYLLNETTNSRNGESHVALNTKELLLLAPNAVLDTAADFRKARNVAAFRAYHPGGSWKYPESIDNMHMQWYSIERAWNAMVASGKRYSRVGFFRVDVQYRSPVSIRDGADAVVPDWGGWGGLNDRLFYGSFACAQIWATQRFPRVALFAAKSGGKVRSELFMKSLLRDVLVSKEAICFFRVRAAGNVMTEDCNAP
jgi:hypothetical protein